VIISRFAHSVILAWGWRRALIAFAAGAISVLALAPFSFWPVLFLTFPVMVWLIDGSGASRWGGTASAFVDGWCFGFGYFLAGLYWIGNAFLVDAKIFGWLLPIAVTVLPAGLALFTGLGFVLARLLWTRGPLRLLALAVGLTVAEWLRGHVLTGLPWNTFGHALAGSLTLAQSASLIGMWGLTFAALLIFASPATLADDGAETRRPWLPVAISALVLAGLAVFGGVRLATTPTEFVADVNLRIMQPNLQQDQKFNYAAKDQVMRRYLALSGRVSEAPDTSAVQASGLVGITHLIWPESAFPFLLTREADALAQIAELLPPGTVLITGAARAEASASAQNPRVYNSLYVIDHDGGILSVYDKVHLVPFGEYLPFQATLERMGLMQLTKLPGGFLAGDRRRAIEAPRAPPFLPLICYEIIFPRQAVPRGEQPAWLLNVTNDAWFGLSPGPYQHFEQARLRAIEEGLPLVRAANTGISAVTDPLGRVVKALPLGSEGVFDAALPRHIPRPFYARTGDVSLAIVVFGSIFFLIRRRLRH
jgi:apolipoprotein N-acyltransferase